MTISKIISGGRLRNTIAGGNILGRVGAGRGAAQEIPIAGLIQQIKLANNGKLGGGGGVTSVAMSVPASLLAVSGSPITSSGTLAVSLLTQNANLVFAGPSSGGAAAPTFRALVAADIPDISATYVVGPGSATASDFAQFDGTTGKLIKDGGLSLDTTTTLGTSNAKIPSQNAVKTYVDNAIAGVNPAQAVDAATTGAANTSGFTYFNGVGGIGATFTGTVNTAVTIDGYTFTALGQRLLVKNDTQSPSGAFNGVYYVTQLQTALLAPILTRALDYDQPSDINETGAVPVINGTVNAITSWLLTTKVATVGTDPLTYTQFSFLPAVSANPTATAGPAAVNGSATTFMRSDAAPAVQKATSSQFGIVEVDGVTITATAGVISAAAGVAALLSDTITSGAAASVTISSIPATFKDLILVVSGASGGAVASDIIKLQFNGDTGANYDWMNMHVSGTNNQTVNTFGVTDTSAGAGMLVGTTGTASYSMNSEIMIPNYAATVFFKNYKATGGGAIAGTSANVWAMSNGGLWRSTAAINAIKVLLTTGPFANGTRVTLYGRV